MAVVDVRQGGITLKVTLPDACSLCLRELDASEAVMVLESDMLGVEGSTTRYVGWHAECAPNWARE